MNSRTTSPRARDGRAGIDADSIVIVRRRRRAARAYPPPARRAGALVGRRLDHLVEHQLPALGLVSAVVAERGVTVRVDVVRPQRALTALGGEERVDHRLAIVTALGDGVADDGHGLVAIDRVRVDLVL